jgi:hypothetical protein
MEEGKITYPTGEVVILVTEDKILIKHLALKTMDESTLDVFSCR